MEFMNLKESNEGLKEKAETLGPHLSYDMLCICDWSWFDRKQRHRDQRVRCTWPRWFENWHARYVLFKRLSFLMFCWMFCVQKTAENCSQTESFCEKMCEGCCLAPSASYQTQTSGPVGTCVVHSSSTSEGLALNGLWRAKEIRPHRRCKRVCLSGGTNTVSFSWGGGPLGLQVKCMVRS